VLDTLKLNEIFHSIQGESSYAGCPCVFVRLSGCNLRCRWCDTSYAWNDGSLMTLDEIVAKVAAHNAPLVEVTGGEPLMQPAALPLLTRLCNTGKTVLLETSGAWDVAAVDARVVKIMDIKCPGSGMCHQNLFDNLSHLHPTDEVKFVIADRTDYDWAKRFLSQHKLPPTVLFSPVWDELPAQTLAEWILADHLPVRLHVQWHKHIWGAGVQGV